MHTYTFLVRKSDQEFESIILSVKNQIVSADVMEDENGKPKYSALVTDEATARVNFTETGHLPSETFEELMNDARPV